MRCDHIRYIIFPAMLSLVMYGACSAQDQGRQDAAARKAGAVAIAEPAAQAETPPSVSTGPDMGKPKEGLVMAGRVYYDWRDYASAIAKWEEALRIDPNDRDVIARIEDAKKKLALQNKKRSAEPQLPKDLAKKKTLFNLNLHKTEKSQLNAGKRWFSWFRKETNAPQMPAGQTLSLNDCIKIACRNHIPLQVAEESMRLADMRLNENKRNLLPSATMAAERYTGEVNARQYYGMKNYIEGQQPVFAGGQLWYAVKQAETNVAISKCDYDKVKNELILQTKKGYYTLAKARENLKIQQDLSKEVSRLYDQKKKEAEFGVTSQIEFLNVGGQYSQVAYQLAAAEGDVGIAELILKQTMNLDPLDTLIVDPNLEFRKIEVNYEESVRAAYAYRPEIKMNTLMVKYYDYGRKIAAGKFFPKIDLVGSWGLAKEEYTSQDRLGPTSPGPPPVYDVDAKLEQQWYGGVKASAPLWGSSFDYSYTREQWVPVVSAYQGTEAATNSWKVKILDRLDIYSDKQQAQIDYDRARQELNKAKQDTTLEVKEGCFNYEKALLQLDTAIRKVKFQESDSEYNRFRAQMDEIPTSTLVESMIKLAQEKFGYAQALTDCHLTIAAINKAIGQDNYYKDEPDADEVPRQRDK
jgi:outer membrane protein TolC